MPTSTGKIYLGETLVSGGAEDSSGWTRPSDWLPLPTVESSDDKILALYAVADAENNYCSFKVESAASYRKYLLENTVEFTAFENQTTFSGPELSYEEFNIIFITVDGDLLDPSEYSVDSGSISFVTPLLGESYVSIHFSSNNYSNVGFEYYEPEIGESFTFDLKAEIRNQDIYVDYFPENFEFFIWDQDDVALFTDFTVNQDFVITMGDTAVNGRYYVVYFIKYIPNFGNVAVDWGDGEVETYPREQINGAYPSHEFAINGPKFESFTAEVDQDTFEMLSSTPGVFEYFESQPTCVKVNGNIIANTEYSYSGGNVVFATAFSGGETVEIYYSTLLNSKSFDNRQANSLIVLSDYFDTVNIGNYVQVWKDLGEGAYEIIEDWTIEDTAITLGETATLGTYVVYYSVLSSVTLHNYDYNNSELDNTLTTGGYKQALITITPQTGSLYSFLPAYSVLYSSLFEDELVDSEGQWSFLELIVNTPNLKELLIGKRELYSNNNYSPGNVYLPVLENLEILSHDLRANLGDFNGSYLERYLTFEQTRAIKRLKLSLLNCVRFSNIFLRSYNTFTNVDSSLLEIELIDTDSMNNMNDLFYNCEKLEKISISNASNVTIMEEMFYRCENLKNVSLIDTSNATDMEYMFRNCESLVTVPLFDTSNATDMNGMFFRCYNLKTVPLFDTSNVTNMRFMFQDTFSLETVPLFDTSNVTDASFFIAYSSVKTIPAFDMSSALTVEFTHSLISRIEITNWNPNANIDVSFNLLSDVELNNIFTSLPEGTGSIYVIYNYGTRSPNFDPSIATNKGWEVIY